MKRFDQTGSSAVVAAGWDFRATISFDSDPGHPVTISSPTTGSFPLDSDPIDPDGRVGTFSFATKAELDDDFPAPETYTFDYGSSSGYTLETSLPAVTLIPEPSRAGWLLGAAAILAAVFRRRRYGKTTAEPVGA